MPAAEIATGATPEAAHGGPAAAHMETGLETPAGEMTTDIPGSGVEGGPATAGGGQLRQFDEGSAEHAVQQLVVKLLAGQTEGLDALITESTTDPILVPLREGKIDPAVLEKAKAIATAAASSSAQPRIREAAGQKTFTVRSRDGQSLSISAKREGDVYKVHRVRMSEADGAGR